MYFYQKHPDISFFDVTVPFEVHTPHEINHAENYVGLVTYGLFKNFNLFARPELTGHYYVLIFGRETQLATWRFEHVCDMYLTEATYICCSCGHVQRSWIKPSCEMCHWCMEEIDVVKQQHLYFNTHRMGEPVTDNEESSTLRQLFAGEIGHLRPEDQRQPWRTFRIGMFGYYWDPWSMCFRKFELYHR